MKDKASGYRNEESLAEMDKGRQDANNTAFQRTKGV